MVTFYKPCYYALNVASNVNNTWIGSGSHDYVQLHAYMKVQFPGQGW